MTGRQILDAIGQAAAELRKLRYQTAASLDDLTNDELEQAGRGLDRLAVDCRASADQLRRVTAQRQEDRTR